MIPVFDGVVVEKQRLQTAEERHRFAADRRQTVAADLKLLQMRKPLADVLEIRPIDLRVGDIEKFEARERKSRGGTGDDDRLRVSEWVAGETS